MKISIIAIFLLVAPIVVLAAGSDVTLTTAAIISVNGITLNISGSSASVQSITVNATNFTVTLASGSSITINAPGLNQLTNDTSSDVSSSVCTGSASSLALSYSGGGTVTNTITPSTSVCTDSSTPPPTPPAPSSGGSSSSGGSAAPGSPAYLSWLSILGLYHPATVPLTTNTNISTTTPAYSFTLNLTVGSRGSAVSALQTWLMAHGYDIPWIRTGAASKGFFGSQTMAAVQKYQKEHGIPATGFVGPLTRASLNGQAGLNTKVACPLGYTCTKKP